MIKITFYLSLLCTLIYQLHGLPVVHQSGTPPNLLRIKRAMIVVPYNCEEEKKLDVNFVCREVWVDSSEQPDVVTTKSPSTTKEPAKTDPTDCQEGYQRDIHGVCREVW